MPQDSLTSQQFLGKFLQKYPQYSSVDRDELLPAILRRYPQYKDIIKDYKSPRVYRDDTLDFSRIESTEERLRRNQRDMPDMMNEEHLKDAGVFGKLFEGVIGGLTFNKVDLGYSEADDTKEMIAQGVGELVGAIPSFLIASWLTGGVGSVPAGARAGQTLNRVRKLVSAADKMKKAGNQSGYKRTMKLADMAFTQAKKAGVPAKEGWDAAIASEKIGYGLLGKSQWYKGKILDLAQNNQGKAAKLLQLASNNLGTFALHGQMGMPFNSSLEERFENLGHSAAGAAVFTAAGAPKIYFPNSKTAKVLETPALFAAGMYSDMGMDENMTMQDRIVNGAALAIFHNLNKGISVYRTRQNIASHLINQFEVTPTQAKKIAWSPGVDNVIKATMKKLKQDGQNIYYKRGDTSKEPAVYFVGPRKIAERNWKPVYRDLITGKETVGFGRENYTTAQRAVSGFKTRYKEMEVDLAERQGPPERPPQETVDLVKSLEKRKKQLTGANDRLRYNTEPVKEDVSGSFEKVIDPEAPLIKESSSLESAKREYKEWSKKLAQFAKDKVDLQTEYNKGEGKFKGDYNPKRSKYVFRHENQKINVRHGIAKQKIEEAADRIKTYKGKTEQISQNILGDGHGPRINYPKNSLVNIPFFKNTAEGFDYNRAGAGRYIGNSKKSLPKDSKLYETESQIIYGKYANKIYNESMGKPYAGKIIYGDSNRPVFEVRTNGGSKKNHVIFNGKPHETFLEAVRIAKEKDTSVEMERLKTLDPNAPSHPARVRSAEIAIENLKKFDIKDFPMMDKTKGKWKQNQESLDFETYQNWETANPAAAKPWSVKLQYNKTDKNGREYPSRAVTPTENGKPIRFDSKEAAEAWSQKNWVQPDGLLKQIAEIDRQLDYYKGTSYAEWSGSRGRIHGGRERAGMSKPDMKNMLDIIFPQAKGELNNLNLNEMKAFEMLIDPASQSKLFNENMSVFIPPQKKDFLDNRMARFWNGLRKITLPFYTVVSWFRGKAGLELSNRSLQVELDRQSIEGPLITYQKNLKKQHNLSRKEHEGLSAIVDESLFGSFYNKSLDKKDVQAIKRSHDGFMDEVLALTVSAGVKVKNAQNAKWERFFRAYDSKGHKIDPIVAEDVMRIMRGYEYLDVRKDVRSLPKEDSVFNREYKVNLPNEAYVREHLASIDKNPWVIIGKNRYVATIGKDAIKWRKLNNNQIDAVNTWSKVEKGKVLRNVEIYNKKSDGSFTNAKGKVNNHIPVPFLPRIVTKEFRQLTGIDSHFVERMAEHLARTSPEYRNMDPIQAKVLARQNIERQKSYWDDSGMFGAQWSRIADLPPILGFDKAGNIISIKGNSVVDINNNIMSKGSKVIDVNGKEVTVDKTIDVYERNYDRLMSTYITRVAHQAAVHKNFPMGESTQAGVKGDTAARLLSELRQETSEDFANWTAEGLKLQLNGTNKIKFEEPIRKWTAFSSHIGLSSPLSGLKNIMLGQAANINTFGFRATMHTWADMLSGGFGDSKRLAEKLGQTEAGVHELYSGKGPLGKNWSTFNPGLMRPTELFNRYTGVVLGRTALDMHINNLHGNKNMMNRGVTKSTSMNVLREAFKFTGKEIKEMMEYKPSEVMNELNPKTEFYRTRAMQQGSLFTQGGPTLPMVPKWMGHRLAKPMTLFYRIAYRVTDAVAKTVIKPAIVDGNPFPLLRYATLSTATGAGIYSMYYYVLGEDRMNRFKSAPMQYWDMFIRGEGLGIMSNAVDSHGGVTDSYAPVIARNADSTYTETVNIMTGKKKPVQGAKDWLKENIVIVNHTMEVLEKKNAAINNRVQNSKRRQRQFGEEYLGEEPFQGEADDMLTTRSPHYRMMRESFWSDDEEAKAKAYYAALQFVAHDFFRKTPALLNNPKRAEKKTRAILKSIINRQRPIPDAWRKRTLGKKSRHELYFELLTPEMIQEEKDLDRQFYLKRNQWNAAISKYRNKYYREIYGDVR